MKSGFRTILERDQLAQQYQGNQFALLQLQAGLQTALDQFKLLNLSLPPEQEVRLDDSVLNQFELNDPRLEALRNKAEALFLRLLQNEALPTAELSAAAAELASALDDLAHVHDQAVAELGRWAAQLDDRQRQGFSGPDAEHDREIYQRERRLSGEIRGVLTDTDQQIDADRDTLETYRGKLAGMTPAEATQALRRLVGRDFRARLSEVSVAQTQTRVFLIELPRVNLTVNQAIQVGIGSRLDLQNALAMVTDNWRNVEVNANQLRGFLNFVYNGQLNSAPGHDTLFRYDAKSSIQTFGIEFDADQPPGRAQPVPRRPDQLPRPRRNYMQTRDTVVQQVRLDMRSSADPPAVRDQPRAVDHLLATARAGRVRRPHRLGRRGRHVADPLSAQRPSSCPDQPEFAHPDLGAVRDGPDEPLPRLRPHGHRRQRDMDQ